MKKNITIYLMGGLGNQLFEYAFGRNLSLNNNCRLTLDISGISNKAHNVLQLNKYCLSKDVSLENKKKFNIKRKIAILLFTVYCKYISNSKILLNPYEKFIKFFRIFGIYVVPNNYYKIKKIYTKSPYFIGYFQSSKYIDYNNIEIIKQELKLKEGLIDEEILTVKNKISADSICIHVRRGDYVNSNFEICSPKYYCDAINFCLKKIEKPRFYVFSDDIEWVKSNISFSKECEVNYMNRHEPTIDLMLMSQCNNFIISNSSFSYWAQYLSNNNELVVAPKIWNKNNRNRNIYQDSWKLIDV